MAFLSRLLSIDIYFKK